MSKRSSALLTTLLSLWIIASPVVSTAAVQDWRVEEGTVSLSLDPELLSDLGLTVVDNRTTAVSNLSRDQVVEGELHSYRLGADADLTFRTDNGVFQEFLGNAVAALPFEGGLAFRAIDPGTQAPLTPAFIYDFVLEIDPAQELDLVRIVTKDPALSVPLTARSTTIVFDWAIGELAIMRGDLVVTREWAQALGQPALAGQGIAGFDLRIRATPVDGTAIAPVPADGAPGGARAFLDVTLGQLYDLQSRGRNGTYPNGVSGLSAATTSCNSGDVIVPWNAPMQETHPTIGLAMFRIDSNNILEMIGQNQMKHGFFALSSNQCNLGCTPSDGTYLGIGCSDTYSAGHNGDRYYLGPRSEIDPVSGAWVACGSFFDEPVTPDADCNRDYFGSAPNGAFHRLEVHDSDLGNTGATYYYEGEYVVRDDGDLSNSIGWRQCTMSWSGGSWQFDTTGGGLTPNYGPFIYTWGDEQVTKELPDHDGAVILATQVTDLGGGQWHYEYALYNWWSRRGVRSFSVPITAANISNVRFHDLDQDAGNDWIVQITGDTIEWSTDDYATDPDAHALFFQTMFNFGFDADIGPEAGSVELGVFLPGAGDTQMLNVQVPASGATSVLGDAQAFEGLRLVSEPNPFAERTEAHFTLDRSRDVRLSVVDVSGRVVRVLVDGPAAAGSNRVAWDGRDESGSRLASGVYFFRLEAGEGSRTVKTTLIR